MENIETIKECEFLEYYNSRTFNANCFNEDGSLNKNYNSLKSTGVISSIFEDHWESTYIANKDLIDKYRPNAVIEVQKIIDCYNKNLGCSVYECPNCHDIIFVGHTCKSRFCSSCGYKYKNDRVESILQTAYNCNHRQIVFTIPEQLRNYFFFPFENRINLLFKELGKSFNKLKKELFIKYSKGFYVYAEPKEFKDFKSGVEYVTRYCGRVPISENRIVNYDGSNVTFSYIGHDDNKYHEVTVNASQFIMILLRHLLPSQFKIIRYYGFYRKKHNIHSKMIPLIKHHCRNFRKQLLKYEVSISMAFHRNPYNCPKCDTKMNFVLSMI